ncbi:MAG: fused MFS/spermidine synthase [Gammaproteobacteria bacterium]
MGITLSSKTRRELAPNILFASTLFCSACLMFVLQPMFGKVLLPLLGGAPSVWNTCMVFFQSILFLGYLYAHLLSSRLSRKRQVAVHGAVLFASALSLPAALAGGTSPRGHDPSLWLLSTLTISIGLPFFVLSTTAPLLQKWFSVLEQSSSHDPYYLYVASNAGSLIALLSYPLLLEPNIGLHQQQSFWSLGFLLLCLLLVGCMVFLQSQRKRENAPQPDLPPTLSAPPEVPLKFRWLVLSAVPSSLLLALTQYISIDIAAVPLLWVIPLALYLISFIIVFSKGGAAIHRTFVAWFPWIITPFLAYYFSNQKVSVYWIEIAIHFLVFFFSIMVCHGELAKTRPSAQYLTHYYLIMSFGGMLGGMFNNFIAPLVFDDIYEYPIMIIAALVLIFGKRPKFLSKKELSSASIAGFIILFFSGLIFLNTMHRLSNTMLMGFLLFASFSYFCFLHKNSLSLIIFLLGVVSCNPILNPPYDVSIYKIRNFYGVLDVKDKFSDKQRENALPMHVLHNGTTIHGSQLRTAEHLCKPTGYYSIEGPIGQFFKAYDSNNENWVVGVIGLGAGTLSAYAQKNQHWTFYELNPSVLDIADNPRYFSYLQDCTENYRIEVGDARLLLDKERHRQYDALIVDAFSSDSIPTHLMTKEALELFFANMKANGLLVFHISNRHLALKKVLSAHAATLGLAHLIQEFRTERKSPLSYSSDWVVLSKRPSALQPLLQSRLGAWKRLPAYPGMQAWTDDFSSIASVLNF